jgi:hypothetical protein
MHIQASVWKPWANAVIDRHPIDDQVAMCQRLQADSVSIKGTNGIWVYGAKENFSALSIYRAHSNDAMEQAAKAAGLGVDMWCYVHLQYPDLEADAIHRAAKRWNTRRIKIDIEGEAKIHQANTGAFLRSLDSVRYFDAQGVAQRCEVYLQSYRRPDLHPEILWQKWLTYKAQDGQHIITGMAPQAYPIGSHDFPGDYKRMFDANMFELARAGRLDAPWHVTLPTFRESGWNPTADDLVEGIDWLRDALGIRLVGVDYWRIGQLWEPWGMPVAEALMMYDWGEVAPGTGVEEPGPAPEPAFLDRPEPERWEVVRGDLVERGVVEG